MNVHLPKPRVVAALAALLTTVALLHWAARFDLRGPDSLDRDALDRWADDPGLVVLTALRWLALVLGYYLLVVVAVVGLTDAHDDVRGLRRLIPAGLAGAVGAALGTTAIMIPLASHMNHAHTPGSNDTASVEHTLHLASAEDPIHLESADDFESEKAVEPIRTPQQTQDDADTWTVALGDHFWSISAETLGDHWGRHDLSDSEIAVYWRLVIEANEDRLVEPGNPDLILPGQVMLLPPPPTDRRASTD